LNDRSFVVIVVLTPSNKETVQPTTHILDYFYSDQTNIFI